MPLRVLSALIALAFSCRSMAHHSFAMFDRSQSVTLVGTVKDYQWSNPHCWIQLVVDHPGGAAEWGLEMGSPREMYRDDWRPTSVKVGDRVAIIIHPLRDGRSAGEVVSATDRGGHMIGKPLL